MSDHVVLPQKKVFASREDIEEAMKNSKETKLGVYQKKDWLGHTGLVLILDNVSRFTIDFGKPNNLSISQTGKTGHVKKWEYKDFNQPSSIKQKCSTFFYWIYFIVIETFGIKTFKNILQWKKKICPILHNGPYPKPEVLKNITPLNVDVEDVNSLLEQSWSCEIKDYHLIEHNCRHFVKKAFRILNPNHSIDLEEIEDADKKRIRALNAVVGMFMFVLVFFYNSLTFFTLAITFKNFELFCISWLVILFVGAGIGRIFEMGKGVIYLWIDTLSKGWKSWSVHTTLFGICMHFLICFFMDARNVFDLRQVLPATLLAAIVLIIAACKSDKLRRMKDRSPGLVYYELEIEMISFENPTNQVEAEYSRTYCGAVIEEDNRTTFFEAPF